MATYHDIEWMLSINETEQEKVDQIVQSLLLNGWNGAPILFHESWGLVTGSHRITALRKLQAMMDSDDVDVDTHGKIRAILYEVELAEDVTDIVDAYCKRNVMAFSDLEFDLLSPIFEGTWVEKYKDEIEEW